ncbi:hypothetical protein Btru_029251 [Bulinus truncatus]|nr:hypothetical protein Btru_029251 [Bulinus truncatus]
MQYFCEETALKLDTREVQASNYPDNWLRHEFSTGSQLVQVQLSRDISDGEAEIIELVIGTIIHGSSAVVGVVSNSLNVAIFVSLNMKTSMGVGLLALSVTDLMVTCLQLAMCSSYLVNILFPLNPVDPWAVGFYILGWPRYEMYLISCWITTLIAIERCACVVSPFKVGWIFTRGRCLCIIAVMYVVHLGAIVPMYVVQRMEWVHMYDYSLNDTLRPGFVYTVVYNSISASAEILIDNITGMFFSVLSQSTLIVCTIWMTVSLRSSSSIRSTDKRVDLSKPKGSRFSKLSNSHLSAAEKRLVKVVLFLAVLLTVCNLPRFCVTIVHHTYPGMNTGSFRNLDSTLWSVAYLMGTMCCSINSVGYYSLNSNYRKIFRGMLGLDN